MALAIENVGRTLVPVSSIAWLDVDRNTELNLLHHQRVGFGITHIAYTFPQSASFGWLTATRAQRSCVAGPSSPPILHT
jgi:hypothetical protein